MLNLDNRILLLQKELERGALDEFQYAVALQKFYSRRPGTFNTRSLRYMESKINEAGLPLTEGRQGKSDGFLAQTVSGFIEGFTTFGFADTPDTSAERIANNVGHLIGLAPGIVVQAISGTGAAVGVVKSGLKHKAKQTGSKKLSKVADKLEDASTSIGNTNYKFQKGLDKLARFTKLKGTAIGVDRATGEKLYGLQSFPGMAAHYIQKQAAGSIHRTTNTAVDYMNKGLFKSKFLDKEAAKNIIDQSVHVGLLLAASAQPLGTRGEGFKGMAMAGVHGAVAGGIFGSIGEYVNIGRMLGSSNATIRKSGENVVRSFAKALGTQPNRIDQYNTINFMMRGGAGATYGTVTSKLHDLPLEDQIYETLLSTFFSVNSRAAFENRATRDIYNSMNAIPRDYNMKEARKWLTEQPWYQNETPEYQAYWSRYLKNIQQQQIDYTINQYNDIVLTYAEIYKKLKDEGKITPEMEEKAKTDSKAKEKILGEMYDALDKQRSDIEDQIQVNITEQKLGDLDQVAKDIENKKFRLDSITLEDGRTIEYQVQEVDPLSEHLPKQKSLKSVFLSIRKKGQDVGVQDLHNMFKKTIDDAQYDVKQFVWDVEKTYGIKLSESQKRDLIQSAHYLKNIDRYPIARIYLVSEGALKKDKDMDPILEEQAPETDIYDKPIGGSKNNDPKYGTSRVNKNYDKRQDVDEPKTLHYDIDYLTTRVLQRYWDTASDSYKKRPRVKNVAPLSVDIFQYIPEGKTDKKGNRIRPIQLAEFMNNKQFDKLAKDLNKKNAFIYAANGATGRIQIRQYPFKSKDDDSIPGMYLTGKDITSINDALIAAGIPVTKVRKKSNVATLIWRMIETGVLRTQSKEYNHLNAGIKYESQMSRKDGKNLNAEHIKGKIQEWIDKEPYESLTKFQKRTKHHSGIEIALDPQYFMKYKNISRIRQIDMDSFDPSSFTEIKLPLDVSAIRRVLHDKLYADVNIKPIFDNVYINLKGKRNSKSNNDLYEQFEKDNPEIVKEVADWNKNVLDRIESGSYKDQDSFSDLSFTELSKIPEFTPLIQLPKSSISTYDGANFKHIIIEDLPSSVKNMGEAIKKNNSGTDGGTMVNQNIAKIVIGEYGYDPRTGVMKTLGVFRPDAWQKIGQTINKTADFTMDDYWQKFADTHGIDKIHYASGIKESTGIDVTKVRWNEATKEFELVGKLNAFESKIEDNYLNLNVYENFGKIGNQKLIQQIMSNINSFEMDPATDIGKKFWDKWEDMVSKSSVGDPKETLIAEKEFLADKELSVNIDNIDIRLIDRILYDSPDSNAAKSILKQIFEIERNSDFDKQSMQDWNDYRQNTYNRQLVEDYLIDTDFDPGTYLRPGVREYVNERIQSYVSKRLTRPRIKHSYSSKLGLYDVLISGRKQKYSKLKKGLANDEFMMNEGARDVIEVSVYEGKKNQKTMTLGEFWDTWVYMKENPTTKRAQKDFEEYENVRKNVAFVRSPMISNGGFRIGEFVGFAKTRKGISLITNEYNDFMMSGADKDIDSAHMFWGLPKELVDVYKQSQIQDQLVRTVNGKKDTVDLKDEDIAAQLASAEGAKEKSREKHLADILDTKAKLDNGKISTMSEDSIGLITNGVNLIGLELDINKQLEDSTIRSGESSWLNKDKYTKSFRQLIIDKNVLLNTYIDAADLSNIDLPIVSLRNMRNRYAFMYEGSVSGNLEARRQAINNMHKVIFGFKKQGDIPLNTQEVALDYLLKTDGAKSYLGILAEHYKGLRLELNPWNVFSKEQTISLLKDISTEIQKHPIYRKVGMKDFSEHFLKGLDPKEFDNIIEYETFLWNKVNQVVDLSNALIRSQSFKEYAIKELEMTNESVDDFITQVVELTFEQRNRIYQAFNNNQQYYKKHNTRSYGDQISITKAMLMDQLDSLSNRRKTEGKPLPERAYREVEDLFDTFYIATPLVKLDFVGFRGEQRFKRLKEVNNGIKSLVEKKQDMEKKGIFFNQDDALEALYRQRGALQAEMTGMLPDREQTWAIRPRNKRYMSETRHQVLKMAEQTREERIKTIRDLLELDKFEQESLDTLNPPPNGRQSKVELQEGQDVVLKTKKMVPDLIDMDVLTDPKKLDALIDSLKPLKKTQTDELRKNLKDFKDLIYQQTALGNETFLFNLPSEYSFFLKRIDRKSDFIQNVDGLRFGLFMKSMKIKYDKDDVFSKIKRNKELLSEVENVLYADISNDTPILSFDEYMLKHYPDMIQKVITDAKGKLKSGPSYANDLRLIKLMEDVKKDYQKKPGMEKINMSVKSFEDAKLLYQDYVQMWLTANKKTLTNIAENTTGKLLKDSDKKSYFYNSKDKRVRAFDSSMTEKILKDKNNELLEVSRLSDYVTNEINLLFPLEQHLRDPKKLDQILGLYQRLDKELAPFEQKLQFDRVIKFNEKTGQMEEYGITVPTSTLKTVAEGIYRLHVNANQISDFHTKIVGFQKKTLAEEQKGYKDNANVLWEYAAVKHTLGEDKLGPKRENTTIEEVVDLNTRLEKAEKEINKINQKFYYVNKEGRKIWVEPKEYADIIISEVIQPLMDYSLRSMIKSNYKNISRYFQDQKTFKLEYSPKKYLLEGHPKHYMQELSQLFLNKHGLIEVRRLLWFDKTVRLSQDKQTGVEMLKNHFHLDDITWIKFHLNLRDHILDKYSDYVTKGGSLDWVALSKAKIKVNKKDITMDKVVRKEIRKFSRQFGEWKSEVGKFALDGVSDRFYPQMGQKDVAENVKYLEEVWLPSEKERIMNKKNWEQLTDSQLRDDVKYGYISFQDAKQLEYQRIENKLLGTNRFENPYVDKEALDMFNQITTRKGKNPYPGQGVTTHARSRLERSMPGWRSDGNVPLDYMNSLSRGVMQNIGAMYSRIYLDKFLQQARRNPRMSENADIWHQTMVDYTRGYMGFPSTRILEVYGVSKKEMNLLKEWQKAGFNQDWKVGKLDAVSKKLLWDVEQSSIPTMSEQRSTKKSLIAQSYKLKSKEIKKLRDEYKIASKERKMEIQAELANIKSEMFSTTKKAFSKWLQRETLKNMEDFIKPSNIDKLNIRKTPRQWFSDESVGNAMLRIEQRVTKVYGKITGDKMFKSLPDDIQLRHKALVERAQYISDLEGRFEVLSLLFAPKAAITNVYGGYQNIITDTGFDHFFKAGDEKYLIKDVFAGQKFKLFNKKTGKFEFRELENKEDIFEMIDSLGLLEGNLLQELAYIQANEPTNVKAFLKELAQKVQAHTRAEKLYGNSKEVNEKIDTYVKKTVGEIYRKHRVDKQVMDKGSYFMSATEKHLRRKAFLAHYLKAREIYSDLRGNIQVTDEFLVDAARKGVEGSQFIYHATYRPNFSNTAFGRIMTRFQPYAWNSIRRRKTGFEDMMAAEGHPQFEATKRFERQVANDMMTMALATLFPYSIFEYALSPPMSWMKETAEFLFGDEETRKKAFFNQYPIQALAPLQIITPPVSRFILPPLNGIINGDWEAFTKYTLWTYFPGGRFARDLYKTVDNPKYAVEYQTGIPYNSMQWHLSRVKRQAEERDKNNEDPTT